MSTVFTDSLINSDSNNNNTENIIDIYDSSINDMHNFLNTDTISQKITPDDISYLLDDFKGNFPKLFYNYTIVDKQNIENTILNCICTDSDQLHFRLFTNNDWIEDHGGLMLYKIIYDSISSKFDDHKRKRKNFVNSMFELYQETGTWSEKIEHRVFEAIYEIRTIDEVKDKLLNDHFKNYLLEEIASLCYSIC
jgi:hypothetical protein